MVVSRQPLLVSSSQCSSLNKESISNIDHEHVCVPSGVRRMWHFEKQVFLIKHQPLPGHPDALLLFIIFLDSFDPLLARSCFVVPTPRTRKKNWETRGSHCHFCKRYREEKKSKDLLAFSFLLVILCFLFACRTTCQQHHHQHHLKTQPTETTTKTQTPSQSQPQTPWPRNVLKQRSWASRSW